MSLTQQQINEQKHKEEFQATVEGALEIAEEQHWRDQLAEKRHKKLLESGAIHSSEDPSQPASRNISKFPKRPLSNNLTGELAEIVDNENRSKPIKEAVADWAAKDDLKPWIPSAEEIEAARYLIALRGKTSMSPLNTPELPYPKTQEEAAEFMRNARESDPE
ncbi:unnamed protein product [Sphagnum balticum]